MKVNMNGLRRNLGKAFNLICIELEDVNLTQKQVEAIETLRTHLEIFNCVYEEDDDMFSDLSEEIELVSVSFEQVSAE